MISKFGAVWCLASGAVTAIVAAWALWMSTVNGYTLSRCMSFGDSGSRVGWCFGMPGDVSTVSVTKPTKAAEEK